MNAVVAIYIFRLAPELLMRFVIWLLINTLYRVQERGLQNIPDQGAVVLAVNHVSFVDALIIAGCLRRQPVQPQGWSRVVEVSAPAVCPYRAGVWRAAGTG